MMIATEKQIALPGHLGLITDGNRRWAKEHKLPSLEGHRQGFSAGKKIIEHAYSLGIKQFTAWAFSTENWNRSKEEIDYLMKLFEHWTNEFSRKSAEKNIKFRAVGQIWRLPKSLQKTINAAENKTKDKNGMVFNLAISYGGRDEIISGIKKIIEKNIKPQEVTEKIVSENLWLPDADLIIRTGGEQRLSGFLAWQSTYAELFFTSKYLPDFTPRDLDKIIAQYAQRERRFGK